MKAGSLGVWAASGENGSFVFSVSHIPNHIAFIMDGNRRYAKKWKLEEGAGYKAGFLALLSMIKYCYKLGVKYIAIYAFSIDNFRRRPQEVQYVMDLMHEMIQGLLKEQSIVNQHGVEVFFVGNLELLNEPVRIAAEKVMAATAKNTDAMLLVCVVYTSSDEIVHSVQESCKDKWGETQVLNPSKGCNGVTKGFRVECNDVIEGFGGGCNGAIEEVGGDDEIQDYSIIKLVDLEKHMYMRFAPDPDILIRTSGCLSNFLLWQATTCLLYCPTALWPEVGLRHLMWAVLNFQRNHSYLEKKKKQS